jgi:hypothetical protein
MEKLISKIIALFTCISLLVSCEKVIEDGTPMDANMTTKARVQFFNAAVGTLRNFLYVDGFPVNGTTIAYGSFFPSSPSTSFAVPAGLRSFILRDTLSTSTQPQLSFAENFTAGSFYTVFSYDTLTAVKQKTVTTEIVVPSDTTARLRLANFIHSSNAVPNIDVFSYRRNANIWSNIPVKEVTGFIPYESRVADTLYVREAGTMIQLVKFTLAAPTPKRSYTVVFRGSYRVPASRTMTSFINY